MLDIIKDISLIPVISPVSDKLSKAKRLLIVEDDKSIRETVREALVAEGYEVEVSKTGDEAQTRIFSQFDTCKKIDLIVLDLMLPNLNGIELCRRVRKNNIKTPILIVSAKDSESDRVLGLEVGADDYLIKPFGLNELIANLISNDKYFDQLDAMK